MNRCLLICVIGLSFGACSAKVSTKPTVKTAVVEVAPAPVEVEEEEPEPERIAISDTIQFRVKSAVLLNTSEEILNEVVATLEERPEVMIEIQGHTDAQGSARRNQSLSSRRAVSVKEYLVEQGIDSRRLTTIGHGEDNPIAENDSRSGREENRRVEFLVLDEDFDA